MPSGQSSIARGAGELRFAVDAGLLFHLGEELVNKRSVALAELIKNAYDADATQVTLTFSDIRQVGGEITVADNGVGMTFERIQDTWMRIATSSKTEHPLSERFKRPRTGAKGIGRFAARRLARRLELIALALVDPGRPQAGREETVVQFSWDAYTTGKQLHEVAANYRRRRLDGDHGLTGVTLRLLDARDAWSAADLQELQRDLVKLISPLPAGAISAMPNQARSDPGFSIKIVAGEFPEFSGDLGETFLAHALGVLEGKLSADGRPSYSLKFRGRRPLEFSPPKAFPAVGTASFAIHFFVYKKDFFVGLPINTRQAQERGREEGGIHIYIDRFRVPPYGDPGDDWLNLDADRARRLTDMPDEVSRLAGKVARPMLLLPGNNQLFGRIHLSRLSNPGIRQTLNRERLIEADEAFLQLRSFVRLGIDWMTVSYAREFAVSREAATEKRRARDPVALLTQARETFKQAAQDMAPEQRAQILQAIELARETIEEQQEEIISELSMLRVLASTGTMIVVFEHQLLGTLTGLRDAHAKLADLVSKVGTSARAQLAAELARLDRWIETTRHQAELLGLLISRRARSRRRRLAIRPVVETIRQAFDSYAKDYRISLENMVPEDLRTPPMFEAELSAIFVNLLTNAFKAVRDQTLRRVGIAGERTDSHVLIRVQDTGRGLARKDWEEYFKPFVGDSEPDPILGEGTGLGLKIVKDFVEIYGGKARFVPPSPPWHTVLEISLPEGEIRS